MSRSHKERHQWKDKERDRKGEQDPAKIQLHRERFLARLKARSEPLDVRSQEPTGRVAMRLRLLTIPDPMEPGTVIYRGDTEIARAEHWAEDPADIAYVIAAADGIENLDCEAEEQRLSEHVQMIQERGLNCHLEAKQTLGEEPNGDTIRLCESCFPCSFRKWAEELSLPLCERPK